MADFMAAVRDFVATATTLEVALATIGLVALTVGLAAWIGKAIMDRRRPVSALGGYAAYGSPVPPPMQPNPQARNANWGTDNGIVFPATGGNAAADFSTRPERKDRPPRPEAQRGEGPISAMLSEGLEEISTSGDRVVDAVRERPLEFIAGALAAGFAAGMLLPALGGRAKMTKLLERLLEANGEPRRGDEGPRDADLFRRQRPK